MTSPNQILANLMVQPHSTNALADSMRLPALVIEAMAKRHAKDGLVTVHSPVKDVDIWSLTDTDTGRETADKLKPAAV